MGDLDVKEHRKQIHNKKISNKQAFLTEIHASIRNI